MKLRYQKLLLLTFVLSIFLFSVNQVYAKTFGIDLVTLARIKVLSLANIYVSQADSDLNNKRAQVENDILSYVDNYIKGLENSIKVYTEAQSKDAQDRLDKNFTDIKGELDSIREDVINNAKAQVDQQINVIYETEQQKLEDGMKKKIEDMFK